jgi:hypothetical protein
VSYGNLLNEYFIILFLERLNEPQKTNIKGTRERGREIGNQAVAGLSEGITLSSNFPRTGRPKEISISWFHNQNFKWLLLQ